jgi:peptidoglycan/LPS O-acetylase OafA/YrhL
MSQRLPELDSLRGIAALTVALFHFATASNVLSPIAFAATAVDFFFIISGFVIFLSIDKINNWREFAFKRFLRLFPTYWICVTITTVAIVCNGFYLATPKTLPLRYLVNLTMLQHFVKVTDMDGPYWTLAVELQFYIFIGLMKKFSAIGKVETVGLWLLSIPIILDFVILPNSPKVFGIFEILLPIINHWPVFIAGIVLYKLRAEPGNHKRYIYLAMCLLVGIFIKPQASKASIAILDYSLLLLSFFTCMLLLINGKLSFLKIKPLLFLGQISYAFYLIHQYIGANFILKFWHFGLISGFTVAFAITILLAWSITFQLEPLFRTLLSYKLRLQSKKSL